MADFDRTVDDVRDLIKHAKLSDNELASTTQILHFSPTFGEDSTVLLEVDEELLSSLCNGESVTFRGDSDDTVVMCTYGQTYEVREAETSNSMLLVPNMLKPDQLVLSGERNLHQCQVTDIHYKYLEPRRCRPRLRKLHVLLSDNLYSGAVNYIDEDATPKKRYSFEDLLEHVQCSHLELTRALTDIEAYNIEGFWCILDFNYRFQVVSHILNFIDSNSWPLDQIQKCLTVETLIELEPREVLNQAFEFYLTKSQQKDDEGNTLYMINEDKVCRLFAEMILKPTGKFNLAEFITIWQQSVPEGQTTNLIQLEGLALVDRSSSPETIAYFPSFLLPEDAQECFNFLFHEREKWTQEEIRPYVRDLADDKVPVSAILTKFTRVSTQDGIKYFSSRFQLH